MTQICPYCNKTEAKHGGKPCVDTGGFTRVLNLNERIIQSIMAKIASHNIQNPTFAKIEKILREDLS